MCVVTVVVVCVCVWFVVLLQLFCLFNQKTGVVQTENKTKSQNKYRTNALWLLVGRVLCMFIVSMIITEREDMEFMYIP